MVPASLGEKFVQLRLWAFSELGGGGEVEERGRKGALSCDCQERGPARIAAGLDAARTAVALCHASRRRSCTVTVPNLPPVSTRKTTRRHRQAMTNSGKV